MKRRVIFTTFGMALLLTWSLLVALGAGAAAWPQGQTGPEVAYPERQEAVAQAAGWLVESHQNEDGGYSSFSQGAGQAPSDAAGTADAILALSGAGADLTAPVSYLRQHAADAAAFAAGDGSTAGKVILALTAAGEDPRNFEGQDFVLTLTNHLSPTGQYNVTNAFNQSLALLALSAVDEPEPAEAVDWLLSQQATDGELDGSWDDGFGASGNTDATAMAVMALVASGVDPADPALARSADFLARAQLESGGWAYSPGLPESANSTALAVQALAALGVDYASADSPFARNGTTPLAALLSWQSETGAFQADFGSGRFDDFFATVQALPAAAGRSYPIRGDIEPAPAETAAGLEAMNGLTWALVIVVALLVAGGALWFVRNRG